MEKKDMDWGNIGFAYHTTDQRYVADLRTDSGRKVI